MTINLRKKISLLFSVWRETLRMPGVQRAMANLANPIDCTRYVEFAYLLHYFGGKLNNLNILDVSSPHALAYLLSRRNTVVKTNIDENERRFIRAGRRLRFSREDGLALSFPDETFDLTYSISVIEHIYQRYADAVREMIRVTKKGGYVYLTFPVSASNSEEWLPYPVYPDQKKTEKGFFFQYRFGKEELSALLASLEDVEVVSKAIYWERADGDYDRMVSALRQNTGYGWLNSLRYMLIHFRAGFRLLESVPGSFEAPKPFGNASIILRKRGRPE